MVNEWVESVNPLWFVFAFTVLAAMLTGVWKVARWSQEVDSDRESFKEFMSHVRSQIDQILERLRGVTPVAERASPFRLNELGQKVSDSANAKDWASRHLEEAKQTVEGRPPFEVQKFCFEFASEQNLTGEEKQIIQQVAFDNGLNLSHMMDVLGIELRDMLLSPKQVDELSS